MPQKPKTPYQQRKQKLKADLKHLKILLSQNAKIPISKFYLTESKSRVKCLFIIDCPSNQISDSQKAMIDNILARQWEFGDIKKEMEHIDPTLDTRKKSCIKISFDQAKI